jgi:hypothetical protein
MSEASGLARALVVLAPWGAGALTLAACPSEEARAPVDAAPSASAAIEPPRPRVGCTRSGSLDAVEKDPACVVDAPDPRDELARPRLAMALTPDAPSVVPGGVVVLRVALTNTSATPLPVVLDAASPVTAPHRDTSLLVGFPDASVQAGPPVLAFVRRTFDSREWDVDQIPMVPGRPGPRALLRVTIPPRQALVKTLEWMALGIPPPAPPFFDDAGRRWVPKTTPRALEPGAYTVRVDVPLHGATPGAATVSARVEVKSPK